MPQPQTATDVEESNPHNRETYLRSILRELTTALENVLGPEDAAGFISIAAQRHAEALAPPGTLSRDEIARVLVRLKSDIGGDFYIAEETADTIVLGNRVCPFAQQVLGRSTLCMTTSNILGSITAKHLGYARIDLQKTIAHGDSECLVVIHLAPLDASSALKGREYFAPAKITPAKHE